MLKALRDRWTGKKKIVRGEKFPDTEYFDGKYSADSVKVIEELSEEEPKDGDAPAEAADNPKGLEDLLT